MIPTGTKKAETEEKMKEIKRIMRRTNGKM